MTIDELIERLNDYRDALGGETEVRLMTQPNWPFENGISGVCSGHDINDPEEDDDDVNQDVENDAVVYICEGQQLGYGSKRAWEVC